MNHPSDTTLALYAGNDVGFLARRRTGRHVARCARCREEVEAYSALRAQASGLAELPGLHWNRLAAEMKANIRLGMAAGECVRDSRAERAAGVSWFGGRALATYASIAALLAAGVLLERPVPLPPAAAEGITLEATAEGIALKGGGHTLSLLHRRAGEVTFSASAQGSMRARYVDSETGYVTINNVYAQ